VNRIHRGRAVGAAAALASLSLFLPVGASAQGSVGSSNDPNTNPPSPSACSGYLWTQDVTADTAQVLSKSHPRIKVDGLTKPAGTIDVPEAITWDARTQHDHGHGGDDDQGEDQNDQGENEDDQGENEQFGQDLVAVQSQNDDQQGEDQNDQGEDESFNSSANAEKFEMMRVEFWKDGQLLAATPGFTPDLPDHVDFAWAIAGLGSVDLLQDADAVYLVHASEWMQTNHKENAFYPRSVCFNWSPFAAPTATIVSDCDNAKLTKTNNSKAPVVLEVTINGVTTEVTLAAGQTIEHVIPLTEDTTTHVTVAWNGQVLLDKTITTNCVPNATTTVPPTTAPPTTATPTTSAPTPPTSQVPTQVLAETQTVAEPALAFTGDHTAITAAIGAALVAFGATLLGIGRRKRSQA
jgi:hypothetical protein